MSQLETYTNMQVKTKSEKMTSTDWNQLIKPRIAVMVALTSYFGYTIGLKTNPALQFNLLVLLGTLFGTGISCVSAGIFNQLVEHKTDRLMLRTANRPLATGVMSIKYGIILGLITGVFGIGLLAISSNTLTALLSAFTIVSYAAVYTPLKRITSTSTIIGAVPGALPPIMGYTAATNNIGPLAVLIFLILFLWQLPHFLAIAWLYRKQYANAGMPMLPVLDPDGSSTFRQILIGCLTLIPLSIVPTALGHTGMIYFFGALIAGIIFLATGIALCIGKTDRHARIMFYTSLIYVPVILVLIMVDQQ